MRIVAQRCKRAAVTVEGKTHGQIDFGLVLLVGITESDTEQDARYLAEKIADLRIFGDDSGKMNDSVKDVKGSILSISQFTLYGDTRKGRRPNFMAAARPEQAEPLYNFFNETLRELEVEVETGVFGAMMEVELINDGPVTLILESKEEK